MPEIPTGGADVGEANLRIIFSACSGFYEGITSMSYGVTPSEQAALTQDILGSVANVVLRPGFLKK